MVQELESQFNAAVEDKNAAIRESERCQLKLQLANRLINALASEGGLLGGKARGLAQAQASGRGRAPCHAASIAQAMLPA